MNGSQALETVAQNLETTNNLLENSPCKDQLAGPGLFLRALGAQSETLLWLIRVHFDNSLTPKERS